MSFPAIYTAVVIIVMAIILATEVTKPAIVVFSALLVLVLGKIITIEEAFAGFSNTGMITVGFLFVVSAALKNSGIVKSIINTLLGRHKVKPAFRYLRLMGPVAIFSAFLNNTPIVASLIHVIKKWSARTKIPASKFLIPLSYAAILGGMCTLIGTSTNLVIHGLLLSHGYEGFSFFELSIVGIPTAILGIIFVAFIGQKLIKTYREPRLDLEKTSREFVSVIKVQRNYDHIGKTIQAADLRQLKGLFLFQIERDKKIIAPIAPEMRIQEKDRLFFTGLPETIYDLTKIEGLSVIQDQNFNIAEVDYTKHKTYEAVVSNTSHLMGTTVRESEFRKKYNAVILAIHRSGSRIDKKVGDIVFHFGDTLFILAEKGFGKKWINSDNFSLISSSVDIYSKPKWKSNTALGILIAMVLTAALGIVPIILAAALAAILMLLLNIISLNEAKSSIDWGILLIIASSFGIGKGIANSGLAFSVSHKIIEPLGIFGPMGIIVGLYIFTTLCTWVITNNAVAALMFPIVLSLVRSTAIPLQPLFITLALAASSSFATPIGYQTNLMVYSAGGYKIKDFLRIGIPMNIFIGLVVTTLIWLFYF